MSEKLSNSGLSDALNLPPYMEARPMKRGGYSYRAQGLDGKWVSLGWNFQEALAGYTQLRGTHSLAKDQSASEIFYRASKGAKQRGIQFDLTIEDVEKMLKVQNWRCAVTQRPFSNKKQAGQRTRPWAASLDRIKSDGHYEFSNCRLVCTFVNIGLNSYGDGHFSELLESLVRRIVQEELSRLKVRFPTNPRSNSHTI